MRIKDFAEAEGVSIHRMYRAVAWAFEKQGKEKASGGRYRANELTKEDMDLCREHLNRGRKTPEKPKTYSQRRIDWVENWATAIAKTEFSTQHELSNAFKVFGVLTAAKTREALDTQVYGARLGDMALEIVQSLQVESADDESSFWHYLKAEGFESPGWEIL